MHFPDFSKAVEQQFNEMAKTGLFRVATDKEALWQKYLNSFPGGSNPIYKERTCHDCNCCKSFIRTVGNVVTIVDGKIVTIWDAQFQTGGYHIVADAMSAFVRSHKIESPFLHFEAKAGSVSTPQLLEGGDVIDWKHFYVKIPSQYVAKSDQIGTRLGDAQASHDVMLRSLNEISLDSIETVLELVAQNSLYKGEENLFVLKMFLELKKEFDKDPMPAAEDLFVWANYSKVPESVTRIRNTSIGTLLTDLSEGVELEDAVKKFESKVAPTNYKRPTALVTKAMIQKAQTAISELGLNSALERRYATIEDITINNILYANREVRAKMTDVFDDLMAAAPEKIKNFDKVEEITIDKFLADVLPKAKSLEVLFENRHAGNLVSLIAPVDPESKNMFKWPNRFSWSYKGDIADSMRERVTELGGRVDGALRFTHAWNHPEVGRNASLMDLHVFMPGSSPHKDGVHNDYPSGRRIGWNKRNDRLSGGVQDVDYTNPAPEGYVPIENISFPELSRMPEGKYVFKIHNWQARDPNKSGFKAEIEFGGEVFKYEHPAPLKYHQWVTLAEVTLKNGVFTIEHKLASNQTSKTVWNLPTLTFQKVNVVMLSPNCWDLQKIGNLHYFFMLDGCLNEDKARGFYNEFLTQDLDKHRKVIEVVGSKMKTEESDRQLSGLGFSSTQRNSLICRVTGSFSRTVKVIF